MSRSLDVPTGKPKTPTPGEQSLREQLDADGRAFLKRHLDLFRLVAGDPTLKFIIGSGFYIDFESGTVSLDRKDFLWMRENGYDESMIVFSVCHELAHFRDLRENPKEMLEHFKYLWRRSKDLVPVVKAKWEKEHGKVPDWVMEPVPGGKKPDGTPREDRLWLETYIYKSLHRLYNGLDDMHVNDDVGRFAMPFARSGSKADDVVRLYRDFLFPTRSLNPEETRKVGTPPKPGEPYVILDQPKYVQLGDYLLRKKMVPNQQVIMSPEVSSFLAKRKNGKSLEDRVRQMTDVPRSKERHCGWRYAKILELVEPQWVEWFLEEAKMPKDASGLGAVGSPNAESIDLDAVTEYIHKKKKADQKAEEDKKKEQKTSEEKSLEQQRKDDQRIEGEQQLPEGCSEEYRKLQQEVQPYIEQMTEVFRKSLRQMAEHVAFIWEHYQTRGKFRIRDMIAKYGIDLMTESYDHIPFQQLPVHLRRDLIQKWKLFPEDIRVRFVLDNSGSTTSNGACEATKRMMVLMMEALGQFEAEVRSDFGLEHFNVKTDVRVFADGDTEVRPLRKSDIPESRDEEIASRFKVVAALTGGGSTQDAPSVQKVNESIDIEREKKIEEGKCVELVLVVTDGGSDTASETRKAIYSILNKKAIVRGFLVGASDPRSKTIFDFIYNNGAAFEESPFVMTPDDGDQDLEEIDIPMEEDGSPAPVSQTEIDIPVEEDGSPVSGTSPAPEQTPSETTSESMDWPYGQCGFLVPSVADLPKVMMEHVAKKITGSLRMNPVFEDVDGEEL